MSKRDAAIYRRAAVRQARDKYCSCLAIVCVDKRSLRNWDGFTNAAEAYAEMFKPFKKTHSHCSWGNRWKEDAQECRILALCFAAAMAEAGDL